MKKRISDKQFVQAYRSAGLWFVALYMEAFILRMDELQDEVKKTYLIAEIFDNGNGPDKNERSTRTRVDCLLRIIESGRIIGALEVASKSNRLNPKATKTAYELLNRIQSGSFVVPSCNFFARIFFSNSIVAITYLILSARTAVYMDYLPAYLARS